MKHRGSITILCTLLLGIVIGATFQHGVRYYTESQEPAAETEAEVMVQKQELSYSWTPVYQASGYIRDLPAKYDAREHGRAPQVKDQGDLGTCWAFASLMALESSLLPEEHAEFSADHMSHNPNFTRSQRDGGEYTMAMAYLLSWLGPVPEAQDPYGDGVSPDGLAPVKHVQEIQILPERDFDSIKRAVLHCGAVQSALYTELGSGDGVSSFYNRSTHSYCYRGDKTANHDVVIVGWDDAYPKENFSSDVPGDGAFLCETSWGTKFGQDGFFYVSYHDARIGEYGVLYSGVESADHYNTIHQSDLCGWIGQLGYGAETAWAANVFRAEAGESIKAAGFYATGPDTEYEVYIVKNVPQAQGGTIDFSGAQLAAAGALEQKGYYTIPLAEEFAMNAGERFAVMVKLTTPEAVHPLAIEYEAADGKSAIDLSDGEGYISTDGRTWQSAEQTQNCNLCLKAYGTKK